MSATFEALSADQVEALLFDRLKAIKAITAAINKAIAAEGIENQVAAWLDVIALGATFTPSTNDDAIVAKIREFLSGPTATKIIGIIADLVGDLMGNVKAKSAEETEADKATVEAAAIPWSLLLTIAKMIFDLIQNAKK